MIRSTANDFLAMPATIPSILTRPAHAADAAAACALVRASIREACQADHGQDPARLNRWLDNKTTDHFARWLADPAAYAVVAEIEGRPAGFALARQNALRLCYVDPALLRRGVGSALLDAIERQAGARQIAALWLHSTRTAHAFYAARGYRPAAADADCAATANVAMARPLGDLQLLPTTQADAEDLVALRIAAMRPSLERLGRYDPERARARFLSVFKPQHSHHLLWRGIKAGLLTSRPLPHALQLDHLYIHPDDQGQGIGSQAMAFVIAQAAALRLPIEVVALRDSDANRFYQRHGFVLQAQSEWDNHYLRPLASPA
ncbi:MAG: GNAT family N-acetyltransferase [Comamonas sp.]